MCHILYQMLRRNSFHEEHKKWNSLILTAKVLNNVFELFDIFTLSHV